MKVVLLCKSDAVGGAAVVTFRLMNALRKRGIDARMLVAQKSTASPYVDEAAHGLRRMMPFLSERLRIYIDNGYNRETLFKIDTGADGISILHHPWIKEADIVCLNWVNQGFISLREIEKIGKEGKKLVWTMHDMWNMTGICHHAGDCKRFLYPVGECGDCPLLGKKGCRYDLSHKIFLKKATLYENTDIHFVAVSRWLARTAQRSSLLRSGNIHVIPNAFPEEYLQPSEDGRLNPEKEKSGKIRIIFGAARLDDDIKGLPVLVRATEIFSNRWPDMAKRIELITFGGIKNPETLSGIAIPTQHLGIVPAEKIRNIYESGDIVVSTSSWETLPGTLIEGQAWGCIPVALDHGGQGDIIDHKKTGFLAHWNDDPELRAHSIAEGLLWASEMVGDLDSTMYKSVRDRFSEEAVANKYISLFKSLL